MPVDMARLSRLSRSVSGKVALITGAASGIGSATAKLFADEGAKLALLDINAEALEKLAGEIREAGTEVLTLPASSYITGAMLVVDGGVTIRNA